MKLAVIDLELLEKKLDEAQKSQAAVAPGLALVKHLTKSMEPHVEHIFNAGYARGKMEEMLGPNHAKGMWGYALSLEDYKKKNYE